MSGWKRFILLWAPLPVLVGMLYLTLLEASLHTPKLASAVPPVLVALFLLAGVFVLQRRKALVQLTAAGQTNSRMGSLAILLGVSIFSFARYISFPLTTGWVSMMLFVAGYATFMIDKLIPRVLWPLLVSFPLIGLTELFLGSWGPLLAIVIPTIFTLYALGTSMGILHGGERVQDCQGCRSRSLTGKFCILCGKVYSLDERPFRSTRVFMSLLCLAAMAGFAVFLQFEGAIIGKEVLTPLLLAYQNSLVSTYFVFQDEVFTAVGVAAVFGIIAWARDMDNRSSHVFPAVGGLDKLDLAIVSSLAAENTFFGGATGADLLKAAGEKSGQALSIEELARRLQNLEGKGLIGKKLRWGLSGLRMGWAATV